MKNVPTRLLVIQRLKSLFTSKPLIVNGVEMDMTGCVESGRAIIGEESVSPDNLPYINILENPRPDFAIYAGLDLEARKDNWTLLIQAVVEDDATTPLDAAYWFYAAVEERLAEAFNQQTSASGSIKNKDTYMLGGIITDMEINPPVIRPADYKAPSGKAIVFLPIRVGIGARMGQPYTSVP